MRVPQRLMRCVNETLSLLGVWHPGSTVVRDIIVASVVGPSIKTAVCFSRSLARSVFQYVSIFSIIFSRKIVRSR